MAQVLGNNQIKLDNGKIVQAQENAWYDGRNYSQGQLGAPGVKITAGVGQGQLVSQEVNLQSDKAQGNNPGDIERYLAAQRQKATPAPVTPAQTAGAYSAGAYSDNTAGGGGAGLGITTPETINLPKLYESLYASSGIRDVESELSAKTNMFNDQVAKIKNNPYLSEATMTGRINKLEQKFAADTANTKNDIAMRKADIETRLQLETKQFDINSQVAQQAFQQFNSLLSSGALDNATGEDIANITRSTGVSSSMIQSAINANRAKNVKSQVIQSTADDGTVTVSVINTDTGEIIKQTSLGQIGNAQTGGKPTATETKSAYVSLLKEDASRGVELKDIFNIYSGYLDPEDIINLYNSSSMFGPAKESREELSKYGVKVPSTNSTQSLLQSLGL